MPIYEYKCRKCNHITEMWQKFSDPPIDQCEECGGKVKKIISQNTFHIKESGWYVTDYASKGSGSMRGSEKSNKDTTTKEAKSATDKSKTDESSSSGKDSKD